MTELEEFVFLLNRHPEAIGQLLKIAEAGALLDEFQEKPNEITE